MSNSKYIFVIIISLSSSNIFCSQLFTREQIASAERKPSQEGWSSLSPREKRSPDSNRISTQPRQTIVHDPHSLLFEPVANDYVQNAYACWGIDDKGKDILLSSGERIIKK